MCGAPLNPEATRAIISSGIYQPFPGPNCREIASPECDVTVQASVSSEGKIPFKGYETWYRVMPHAEEPERYMAVLDGFLGQVEAARAN